MIRYFISIILFSIMLCVHAQDTLYINLNSAVQFAQKNSTFHKNLRLDGAQRNNSTKIVERQVTPTEFSYEYGQLYSPENSWKLSLDQDFGNPIQDHRKNDLLAQKNQIQTSRSQLAVKNLELQIKSRYLEWIYLFNLADNIHTLREYLNKISYVSQVRHDLGETEFLEDLKLQNKYFKLDLKYKECIIDVEIAANELKKLINTTAVIVPANRKLEMYMVGKKADTSSYNGKYISDIYLNQYNYSISDIHVKKAAYYPGLKAGVFVQKVGPNTSLKGIQAGISIPLLSFSNKKEVTKSKIESEKKYNEYLQSVNTTNLEIDNLLLQLDKHFLQIRHFQNYSLITANNQLKTATVKYQVEEIDYIEYVELISEALLIKREYLELINTYNQTALKLELYTK